jgi:hypothetical protein
VRIPTAVSISMLTISTPRTAVVKFAFTLASFGRSGLGGTKTWPRTERRVAVSNESQRHLQTFPDGATHSIAQLGDGRYRVELASGEIFEGRVMHVLGAIADALANTKAWARHWRAIAKSAERL